MQAVRLYRICTLNDLDYGHAAALCKRNFFLELIPTAKGGKQKMTELLSMKVYLFLLTHCFWLTLPLLYVGQVYFKFCHFRDVGSFLYLLFCF